MSTMTKVFVVLLVLFSIAFTVMTVSVVAQTTDWRDTALKYEQHAKVADTNLRNLIAANAAELASSYDVIKAQQQKIASLEGDLQSKTGEAAELQTKLTNAEAAHTSAQAMNRGLLAQLSVADSARSEYQKQRDDLEKRNIDLERRNIDLNDRVNELTSRMSVLLEEKRQFEQQINVLRQENLRLSQATRQRSNITFEDPSGAAMPGVTALTPVAATAIRGRVLAVSGGLVTLSVGSADGVKKGMIFVVHRDGAYLGDVEINIVDPNQSAGKLIRSTTTPTVGDQATDEQGIAGSRG